jgi:hypothetical protein
MVVKLWWFLTFICIMAVKLLVILVEISQIIVVLAEMSILICYFSAGAGKPATHGHPLGAGAGKIFLLLAALRAGKGRQRGYARGRVNFLYPHLPDLLVFLHKI